MIDRRLSAKFTSFYISINSPNQHYDVTGEDLLSIDIWCHDIKHHSSKQYISLVRYKEVYTL